jgi:hypothetical protein
MFLKSFSENLKGVVEIQLMFILQCYYSPDLNSLDLVTEGRLILIIFSSFRLILIILSSSFQIRCRRRRHNCLSNHRVVKASFLSLDVFPCVHLTSRNKDFLLLFKIGLRYEVSKGVETTLRLFQGWPLVGRRR